MQRREYGGNWELASEENQGGRNSSINQPPERIRGKENAVEYAAIIGATAQVVTTLAIATFAVYVAKCQHETARNKLKLDLFDRRYKVYLGIRDLFAVATREARVPNGAFNDYWAATHEGRFLFEADIRDYITEVRKKIAELRNAQAIMDANRDNGKEKEREAAIEKEHELLTWVNTETEQLAGRFHRYLGFEKNL